MPQLFSPRSVLVVKLTLLGALLLTAAATGAWRWKTSYPNAVGAPVAQPIPFSHKHHVGDDGIDCRYCHTSVEKSAFAGLPSTDICMTCHSQLFRDARVLAPLHESWLSRTPLRWNRVHDLPDFVFFDHSIHVAKGVACQECHGRVDQMPLTRRVASLEMQWCLGCHRNPAPHLHPRQSVFAMGSRIVDAAETKLLLGTYHLLDERRLTDCSTCHR